MIPPKTFKNIFVYLFFDCNLFLIISNDYNFNKFNKNDRILECWKTIKPRVLQTNTSKWEKSLSLVDDMAPLLNRGTQAAETTCSIRRRPSQSILNSREITRSPPRNHSYR